MSLFLQLLPRPPPPRPPRNFSWRCTSTSTTRSRYNNNNTSSINFPSAASLKPHFQFQIELQLLEELRCLPSSSDSNEIGNEIEDRTGTGTRRRSVDVDGVEIEIEKLPNNSRRILSSVAVAAPLDGVWRVLTDYERLSDFIPGLSVSRLLLKSPNYARLFQIGSQDLAFGLKFHAKGILDCYEKPLETDASNGSALKRDIEFEMVEGDFEIFRGKWSLQQQQQLETQTETLVRYMVDVKPKLWLPVGLVEGRLCDEIKINLACIRQHAQLLFEFDSE